MDPIENPVLNGSSPKREKKSLYGLDPRFECPICLNCLKEPFLTKCGHRFCQDCILEWLRKKKRGWCPVDGNNIEEQDLFPDNYTRREITQQTMKCGFSDCEHVISLLEMESHIAEIHEDDSTKTCFRTTESFAKEADTWDPPPKKETNSQNQLITSLFERVVQLEQKTRELELNLTSTKGTIKVMQIEKEQLFAQLPLRICNGAHLWHVTDIREKLLKSREAPEMFYSDGFYTSYLGYKFCVRLNLSPSNPSYLSLLVHLMKSENDYILSWPFKGRISFSLIHPTSPESSLSEVMCTKPGLKAFDKPTVPISQRAFGYTEFTLLNDVLNKGYVTDDGALNIKVEITCV